MRVTEYTGKLTSAYVQMYQPASPVAWLMRALEDYSIALAAPYRRRVLDVACGVGSYCLRTHALGASCVVGVDISESQILECRRLEADGVKFFVADARELESSRWKHLHGAFDLVHAAWLYDTAACVRELHQMTHGIRKCLQPGGLHCGMIINPQVVSSAETELARFGVSLMDDKPAGYRPSNGELIRGRMLMSPPDRTGRTSDPVELWGHFYTSDSICSALLAAGFSSVRLIPAESWDTQVLRFTPAERNLFTEYVKANPEMCAFLAT